jgi:hypothetical protein
MNDLMRKGYEREGFTKDQIDTIERKQLVKNTYGASPSYKEPEPEKKSSNNSSGLTNAELAALAKRDGLPYYGTAGSDASQSSPRNTSRSNSFSNIRVGNTNNTNTSNVKDYGNVASAQQGPMPTGPSGYKKPGSYDPNKIFNLAPGSLPSPNIPYTGPGRSNVPGTKDYGNVASAKPLGKVGGFKGVPKGKGWYPTDENGNPYNPQTGLPIKQAGKKQKSVVAHHEPKGKVLSEKKKLKSVKDITSKIPGYYDGKPAPLGFPMQEPPKMVNGFHPDLVDGKKIANRFNRLDPQSAKAMPPTGNPHIDKKVRAAAKKPK